MNLERSTLKNETLKCVEVPRENEPGDNKLGGVLGTLK